MDARSPCRHSRSTTRLVVALRRPCAAALPGAGVRRHTLGGRHSPPGWRAMAGYLLSIGRSAQRHGAVEDLFLMRSFCRLPKKDSTTALSQRLPFRELLLD